MPSTNKYKPVLKEEDGDADDGQETSIFASDVQSNDINVDNSGARRWNMGPMRFILMTLTLSFGLGYGFGMFSHTAEYQVENDVPVGDGSTKTFPTPQHPTNTSATTTSTATTAHDPEKQNWFDFSQIVEQYRLAKVFHPHFSLDTDFKSHSYAWCEMQESQKLMNEGNVGIIYNKTPKTASTTIAGITIRLAKVCQQRKMEHKLNMTTTSTSTTISNQKDLPEESFYFTDHSRGNMTLKTQMLNRNIEKSFLFSSIRDPASRAISRYFFTDVSFYGKNAKDKNVIKFLQGNTNVQYGATSEGQGGFLLNYLSLREIEPYSAYDRYNPANTPLNQTQIIHTVRQIMADYDFIVMVERLDESLVLMQLMLGMDTNDILYMSSKLAGSYWYSKQKRHCILLQKSFKSPAVKEYLLSQEFVTESFGDYLLLEAVNKSIDSTIETIGKGRFQYELGKFQRRRVYAEEQCANKVTYPCSGDGENNKKKSKMDCYKKDWGCGYRCLDSLKV